MIKFEHNPNWIFLVEQYQPANENAGDIIAENK